MRRLRLMGGSYELRPISAYDAVRGTKLAQKAAAQMEKHATCQVEDLCDGACMAALCLYRAGRRAFSTPLTVLRALSVEEITRVQREYLRMMSEEGEDEA
ncbi:hypothetical protein [Zongyangia hominis]|uniref:Uncharacterized protein n=1 Tax=Zongyangia hominis TaxID=2763677 RepID=A0A926ECH1_9FIRM|nr:hypothetical protein [Zongyangia hominis]MBC8570533.1 hypothetical protein [Zongyangia hominis]